MRQFRINRLLISNSIFVGRAYVWRYLRSIGLAEEADALEKVPDEHLAWNGWVLEKSLA